MTKDQDQCGEILAFDSSDPGGGCILRKGHKGHHVLEDGTDFTDADNAKARKWAASKFAEFTGLSFEAACGHFECNSEGYPKKK